MEKEIKEAIQLLKQNGYYVKKITKLMEEDIEKCRQGNYEGDCSCCACNICIVTGQ